MATLATNHFCNHCVISEKTYQNILIGPGKLPGLSRNGPHETVDTVTVKNNNHHQNPGSLQKT